MKNDLLQRTIDGLFVEFNERGTLHKWAHMVEEGIIKTKDVIRVEINDDGTVNLLDFTLPTKAGMETVSMLRITESSDLIPALGFKVSDQLYYILNREGEMK
jgi:hypothetical protein